MSEDSHTFLFADLSGFTALTEAHGDQEAAELAQEFFQAVRGLLSAREAEAVKTIGDAVMLRVPAATEAIRLGIEIVDDLGERPRFPVVHVGMHTGPAVRQDGDWFGATVNLAARIAAAAGGDEVLLTKATREAAGPLAGVELQARGQERFRNVVDPIQLYRAWRLGKVHDTLPVDPVCRMTVAPDYCVGKLVHEGAEFCFCSLECAGAFAAHPERYLDESLSTSG